MYMPVLVERLVKFPWTPCPCKPLRNNRCVLAVSPSPCHVNTSRPAGTEKHVIRLTYTFSNYRS